MIDKITISPNRGQPARCRKCQKKIAPLEVRGMTYGTPYNGYLCSKCTREQLSVAPEQIRMLEKEYQGFADMSKEERKTHLIKVRILNKLS